MEESLMQNSKSISVLILCTANSARSQIAEGLLKSKTQGQLKIYSAGVKPDRVHPMAIKALSEIDVDISSNRSKHVKELQGIEFTHVITVCDNAKESCPLFLGDVIRIHRSFKDPSSVEGGNEKMMAAFREVRDEMSVWLDNFLKTI